MKKIAMILGAVCLLTIASCKKKEDVPMTPPEVPMVTEEPAPAPPETVIVQPVPEEGTTVKVGNDGVDVKTPNTKVTVNGGGAAVEVKK